MLHRPSSWVLAVPAAAVAALLVVACEDAPAPAPAATTTAVAAQDLRGICSSICDRTTECALAIAKKATRGYEDKPDVQRAVADEERAARANLDACKKDCREQPIVDSDRGQLTEAAKCLGQSDCDGFVMCFERIGSQAK